MPVGECPVGECSVGRRVLVVPTFFGTLCSTPLGVVCGVDSSIGRVIGWLLPVQASEEVEARERIADEGVPGGGDEQSCPHHGLQVAPVAEGLDLW